MSDWRKQLEAEKCTCEYCPTCNGTGNVWYDFAGRYLGNSRCDDLDSMESCDECRGGITDVCERCQMLEDLDHDEDRF